MIGKINNPLQYKLKSYIKANLINFEQIYIL